MLEQIQAVAFEMISIVGTAKSMYIEALTLTKQGNYDDANKMIKEADEIFSEVHSLHFDLIQKEASGEQLPFSLMLMHAEDQLLTTETLKILILELIEIYIKE